MIQSDCLEVISMLKNEGFTASIPASSFVKVIYSFYPRDANLVAHTLAKDGRLLRLESLVWVDDPPSSLMPLIIHDVSLI